jgi:hypothetical protein
MSSKVSTGIAEGAKSCIQSIWYSETMKWNAIPADYAAKAISAKALARKNYSRENLHVLVGVLAGTAIGGLTLWMHPFFFEENRPWGFLLIAAAGMGVGFIFYARFPYTAPAARCPNCGHDWTIREGKTVPLAEQMLQWDQCPGCGALMHDALLRIAGQKGAKTLPVEPK